MYFTSEFPAVFTRIFVKNSIIRIKIRKIFYVFLMKAEGALKVGKHGLNGLFIKTDVVSFKFLVQCGVFDPQKFRCAFLASVELGQSADQNAFFHISDQLLKGDLLSETEILDKEFKYLFPKCSFFPFIEILRADFLCLLKIKKIASLRDLKLSPVLICSQIFCRHCISPYFIREGI